MPAIDFASCHLYPESWNVPLGAGNEWIRDHVRIAQAIRKPLIVGEFGVRESRDATYASWLTTTLHDGAAGAMVWHLLEGPRANDGFGIRCSDEQSVCEHLGTAADSFIRKSRTGVLPLPQSFRLQQNYPNPFNNVTTISYSLPHDSHVNLSVFNGIGQHVAVIVDGIQSGGERKELFGGEMLASGAYFYRLHIGSLGQPSQTLFSMTKRLVLIH